MPPPFSPESFPIIFSIIRHFRRLSYEAWENAAFVLLGRIEKSLLLALAERKLEFELRLRGRGSKVDAAYELVLEREQTLVAGRKLNADEAELAEKLRDQGATPIEIWIMFSGKQVRSQGGQITAKTPLAHWFGIAAVSLNSVILGLLLGSVFVAMAVGSNAPNWGGFICLTVLCGLSTAIWDLYLVEPILLVRKWRSIFEASGIIH